MPQSNKLNVQFLKALIYSSLSFFLLPAIALAFVMYAQPKRDAQYIKAVAQNIGQDARLEAAQKDGILKFVAAYPPSSVCNSEVPEVQVYRGQICGRYSGNWQFAAAGSVARWTLLAGAGVFAAIFTLGALAFANRRAQYLSFVTGWRFLSAVSALEVIVQGAFVVWLSFWVTAFFFQSYSLKLVIGLGVIAASAAFYAVIWIFKRQASLNYIEGVPLDDTSQPRLWSHVRALAAGLRTAPPDNIVAGIDTNFFVTEMPLNVSGTELRGRSLFVSLPLLRVLDTQEADAVFAHELAHFSGGDAASSARLNPKLLQFDIYSAVMRAKSIFVAYHIMRLYRFIFEFALQRDSRRREFIADRTAAQATSAQAIVQSLIKVAAYASYRNQIERQLFEQNLRHENSIGIASRVAAGLRPYAGSAQFIDDVRRVNIPHPFDSHPSLPDRMRNVDHTVEEAGFAAIATGAPERSWTEDIADAGNIETKLWANYEQHFAEQHERNLAYRYLPADASEEAVVLKYFPPLIFSLKQKKTLEVRYSGLTYASGTPGEADRVLAWDEIVNLQYKSNSFRADRLIVYLPKQGLLPFRRALFPLAGIGKEQDRLKAVLGIYMQRHRTMRQFIPA